MPTLNRLSTLDDQRIDCSNASHAAAGSVAINVRPRAYEPQCKLSGLPVARASASAAPALR